MTLKKVISGLGLVVGLLVGSGWVNATQPAQAKRTVKATKATPVKARGTWYSTKAWADKMVIKKHAVRWYQQKDNGKWKLAKQLKGKKLEVRHVKWHKRNVFGFYTPKQKYADFSYLTTKKVNGKKVRAMVNLNGYTYYHTVKLARAAD